MAQPAGRQSAAANPAPTSKSANAQFSESSTAAGVACGTGSGRLSTSTLDRSAVRPMPRALTNASLRAQILKNVRG